MAIILTFLLGIVNFAAHKAVLESGHPMLGQMPWFHIIKGRFSLIVEFLMLLGAMLFINTGATGWALGYAFYSAVNGIFAWLILSGKV